MMATVSQTHKTLQRTPLYRVWRLPHDRGSERRGDKCSAL